MKKLNLSMCTECCYRTTETRVSRSGKTYEIALCMRASAQLKLMYSCPENYSEDEYRELLRKGDKYDAIRYGMEAIAI